MDTLADLVAAVEDGRTALVAGDRDYPGRKFRATAYRTGNFLRHCGVREGATVAVADDRAPEPLFALLGGALLGAAGTVVAADAPTAADASAVRAGDDPGRDSSGTDTEAGDGTDRVDARALVAPTSALDGFSLPPGGRLVGYGSRPANPAHAHFERDVWSENPAFPAVDRDPDDPALRARSRTHSHGDLLAAARAIADDLDEGAALAIETDLADPRTVAAALAPPLVGGAVVLGGAPADAALVPESSEPIDPEVASGSASADAGDSERGGRDGRDTGDRRRVALSDVPL